MKIVLKKQFKFLVCLLVVIVLLNVGLIFSNSSLLNQFGSHKLKKEQFKLNPTVLSVKSPIVLSEKIIEPAFSINDILITVKTTSRYEYTRWDDIIDTWYQFAKSQIYFVSDKPGNRSNYVIENKVIYTNCGRLHDRDSLCCKFGHEMSLFFQLNRTFKWFCHVDDDNYINIPNLVTYLSKLDHNINWYIGRTSWGGQVSKSGMFNKVPIDARFYFGTLGAGVCLSNSTMYAIKEYASEKSYMAGCESVDLPDDMYLGYLLEWVKKIKLKNELKFNHHLDVSQFSFLHDIHSRVTLSFGPSGVKYNATCQCEIPVLQRPKIATLFPNDTYRIKSLHCLLFPAVNYCRPMFLEAFQKLYTLTLL